jgi:hypothetical protein
MGSRLLSSNGGQACLSGFAGLCLWLAAAGWAYGQPVEEAPVSDQLPTSRHLAAALSEEASRRDTLLTITAVAQLLNYGRQASAEQAAELEARFRDDRAWLDRLASRFADLSPRPSLLDPSAWFVTRELEQHGLLPDPLVSPLGPDGGRLLRQLFDRDDELLAAALLPEILPRSERDALIVWRQVLERLPFDPTLASLLMALQADWFDPWMAAEPPAPARRGEVEDVVGAAIANLRALASASVHAGPPDALRLKRLRFGLLNALPDLTGPPARDAAYTLALATAVDGLHRGESLAFAESLLWVVSDLLFAPPLPEHEPSRLPRVLVEMLPILSNAFAADFAAVDPRLNGSLASVFDAAQYLQTATPEPSRLASLRGRIANEVAQLVLLIPDIGYYFDQPVRRAIAEEVNICISIAADRDEQGRTTMGREQFDACLESLSNILSQQLSRAELAGDPDGPFGTEHLRRELLLTPWQRINYVLGYLHSDGVAGCEMPPQPLPNPLEWASIANLVVWFAQQSPVYFQTPQNEALLIDLRQQGQVLMQSWTQQVDCLSGAGTGLNDPVSRGMAGYRSALEALVAGLREADLDFRAARLKAGSDVMVSEDATQRTAFRNEGLMIGPCDPSRICEMGGALEATRALVGLFPDAYLIADQTGLGELEICYDNVRWVNRRSEPVRADDPHVANYFGRLSFDLVGRYREGEETSDVFGFNFLSPAEYHYLFAAASDEVLEDDCPTEWIGTRIVTRRGGPDRFHVVPDRLTYLASARRLPSQVIGANWNRNEEWRDRFVTGLDVTAHEHDADTSITDRVNQHLRSLYQAEQALLYSSLLRPDSPVTAAGTGSLHESLQRLTASKSLLRSYMNLFYPQYMVDSDEIRAALEGQNALLDRAVLRRFREANVAIASVHRTGLARLEQFQALWNRQPEAVRRSGTAAIGMAHALTRLNSLYFDFFDRALTQRQPADAVTY